MAYHDVVRIAQLIGVEPEVFENWNSYDIDRLIMIERYYGPRAMVQEARKMFGCEL